MSTPINPSEIIRCLRYDGYTHAEGAAYAERLARNAQFNPWAEPGDADAYAEAARRLRSNDTTPALTQ